MLCPILFSLHLLQDLLASIIALHEVAVATILTRFELGLVFVDDVATVPTRTMPTNQAVDGKDGAGVLFSMSLRDKCSGSCRTGGDEGEKKKQLAHEQQSGCRVRLQTNRRPSAKVADHAK
jgi:hypothetical protein